MQKRIVSLATPILTGIIALALGWFAHAAVPLSAQGIVVDGHATLFDPAAPSAPAGTLARLTYQGRLTNISGAPINSAVNATFRLYDSANSPIYTATRTITPTNGLFTVYLGDGNDDNLNNDILGHAASIGVTVGSDPEMTPHQALNSVVGHSENGAGVTGSSSNSIGVYGSSRVAVGVYGSSPANIGVYGLSDSGKGVFGFSTSSVGVQGLSGSGKGVVGSSTSSVGVQGSSTISVGVQGSSTSYVGVYGSSSTGNGVAGISDSNDGVIGSSNSSAGVHGFSNVMGVWGASDTGRGVFGDSTSNDGVYGNSSAGAGVHGFSDTNIGVTGSSNSYTGVVGVSNMGIGVVGSSNSGDGVLGFTGVITRAGVSAQGYITGAALEIRSGNIKVTGAGISTTTPVFIQQVNTDPSTGNLCTGHNHATVINNPLINDNPKAILIVTPNSGVIPGGFSPAVGTYGVFYDGGAFCGGTGPNNKWVIYIIQGTPALTNGSLINVMAVIP